MQKIEITTRALKENLSKLHAFATVARLSSISRAASHVPLSQSALSHLISNLESSLGLALFKRRAHGLELTPEGKVLLDFTSRLFLDVDSLASRLIDTDSQAYRNIRIGTHETLAAHIWPQTMAGMARQEPKLKVSLLSGRVDELIAMLLRGDIHAAATVEPKTDTRLRVSTFYSGRLLFFAGKKLLKKKKRIHLRDLKKIPIFTDTQAHIKQGLPIPHALHQLGFENPAQFEFSSFEAAISLAEMNLGVAVIPDRSADRSVKEGRLTPLSVAGLTDPKLLDYKICVSTCLEQTIPSLHETLLRSFAITRPS